jgi:hypothetical protein
VVCFTCFREPDCQLPDHWQIAGGGNGGGGGGVGPPGPPGEGVPPGGAEGQLLAKTSAANFATTWVDPPISEFEEGIQETTERWIDGRPIIRYTVQAMTGASPNQTNDIRAVPNFDNVVRFDGYCVTADGYDVPVGFGSGGSDYFSAQIRASDGMITETHGSQRFSGRPIVIVAYYVERAGAHAGARAKTPAPRRR